MSNQLIPVTFSASALKPAMTVFPPVPTALFLWYLGRHLIKSISSPSLADLLLEKAKRNRIHPLQILCWKKQNERVITREGRRNMQFYGLARISWFHYVAYCFAADTNFSFVSFVCFFCCGCYCCCRSSLLRLDEGRWVKKQKQKQNETKNIHAYLSPS